MRILYIYDGNWPKGATRVRKQTRALADAGHEVLLVARNEDRQRRVDRETWMQVRRLPTFPGRRLNRALNFPLFFSPVWLGTLWSAVRRFQPDGIIVEDLPLAPSAVAIARFAGKPLLYDMGEVYPAFLEGLRKFERPSLPDRILRSPAAARRVERWVLKRVDHTFVVSEESRARALSRGALPAAVTIVGNTPENLAELSDVPTEGSAPPGIEDLRHRPVILFVGILISDRGVPEAVQAMSQVIRRHPDAVLVIVGEGIERPRIERLVEALNLQEHVRLVGWQPHEELPRYYHSAKIGLLPFLDGGQIRYTLANKLFDYMGAGLPFIASDVPPMRRIAEESGAGLLVKPGDPADLAATIVNMLELPDIHLKEMGRAGREIVLSRYNWAQDAARLVGVVERELARTA